MAGGGGNNNSNGNNDGSTSSSNSMTDFLNNNIFTELDLGFRFQMLYMIFAVTAAIATFGLFLDLRRQHRTSLNETENASSSSLCLLRYARYLIPTAAAVAIAYFHTIQFNNAAHFLYIIILGVLVPLGLAILLLFQGILNHWKRSIPIIIAWLLWISASVFTSHWYWHYKNTHSDGYDVNPHLSVRNGTLIPLWVVTILFTIAAIVWGRYQARHEQETSKEPLLPVANKETTENSKVAASTEAKQSSATTTTSDSKQSRRIWPWTKQKQTTTTPKRGFSLPSLWSKKSEKTKKGFFA